MTIPSRRWFLSALLLVSSGCLVLPRAFSQGSLTPLGAPAPTMKTLGQIEPRTPISSLPFAITAAGSYYLTGNLTGAASTTGIAVNADNVTIDLGGFELVGAGPADFANSGIILGAGFRNLTVKDGTVRNWPYCGITSADGTSAALRVEKVRAIANLAHGIFVPPHSVITGCVASGNGYSGFLTFDDCRLSDSMATGQLNSSGWGANMGVNSLISGCTFNSNAGTGLLTSIRATIIHCTADENGGEGFEVSGSSVVTNCMANNNATDGFQIGFQNNVLTACIAGGNGNAGFNNITEVSQPLPNTLVNCTAHDNAVYGIAVLGGSSITGCNLTGNGIASGSGAGIYVKGSGTRVDSNNLAGNYRGVQVITAGNFIVRNSARGGTAGSGTPSANYSFTGTQTYGSIITATGVIASTATPWSNFEF